jgi:hypothetical protein
MDVVEYSVNKRANNAFDVTSMFTHEEGTIKKRLKKESTQAIKGVGRQQSTPTTEYGAQ